MEEIVGIIFLLILLVIGASIYLLPTIIAKLRNKKDFIAILALNIFLGWSLLGWVISLVWALKTD